MSSDIYSSPLFHTVYYSREPFQTLDWSNKDATDGVARLIFDDLKLKNSFEDFGFNVNTYCTGIENSTFMRLNACALFKLRHWSIHPSNSTVMKVAKYSARIFFAPIAATWDLAANTVLLALKILAYPVIRLSKDLDKPSKNILGRNVFFQGNMVFESLGHFFSACIGSTTWGFAGPQVGFTLDAGPLWGFEVQHSKKSSDYLMNRGEKEVLLDTNRVKYLRDHCGFGDLSDEQLKSMNFTFPTPNATATYYLLDKLHLTLYGTHKWSTGSPYYRTTYYQPFHLSKVYPLPISSEQKECG